MSGLVAASTRRWTRHHELEHARGSGPAELHGPATNHASSTKTGPMEMTTHATEWRRPAPEFEARTARLF